MTTESKPRTESPAVPEPLIAAADEAADLLALIEAAAKSITEVTADQRDEVIKGFRSAEAICSAARRARERLEAVLYTF